MHRPTSKLAHPPGEHNDLVYTFPRIPIMRSPPTTMPPPVMNRACLQPARVRRWPGPFPVRTSLVYSMSSGLRTCSRARRLTCV